jgi:murein DD-endopeptidase MepM/ murein hydrolase activator NlpD
MSKYLALAACCTTACMAGTDVPEVPVGADEQRIEDDVVGASVVVPARWTVSRDPVLFDSHGFFVHDADEDHHHAIARIAYAYGAAPRALDELVADKLALYPTGQRLALELPGGRPAVAVTHLPGSSPYAVVFTSDDDRVYEIGLWSEEDESGLDDRGRTLLERLRFRPPTRDVHELGLVHHAAALYDVPPPDLAAANARASQERRTAVLAAAARDPELARALDAEIVEPPRPTYSCGFTAPRTLYWQLQWDRTNSFYSGSHYKLRDKPGWSAMSGNWGSWWGTNYHVGLCYTHRTNQYYANDWPAQSWANAYAAFSGTVEWAGWGTDGFATLGRYVVVRNGAYRSTTAHLVAIRAGVRWGTRIDGYWDTIGWAGSTGGPWAPHLHARVSWGESLTANGQPYGGQSVRPARLRCFDCKNYDVAAPGGGGYYTQYWHGRWMRY